MRIEVEPQALIDAGKQVGSLGGQLGALSDAMGQTLSDGIASGMDPAGLNFGISYGRQADEFGKQLAQLANAFKSVGLMLEATGFNYKNADAASTAGGPGPSGSISGEQAETTAGDAPYAPNGSIVPPPSKWWIIQPFLNMIPLFGAAMTWPTGNAAMMNLTAAQWANIGRGLKVFEPALAGATAAAGAQSVPEVDQINKALKDLGDGATKLANFGDKMATTISDFAKGVQETQDSIRRLLDRLSLDGLWDTVTGLVTGDGDKVLREIAEDVGNVLENFQNQVQGVLGLLSELQTLLGEAADSFQKWIRPVLVGAFGDDVGNVLADAVKISTDLQAGLGIAVIGLVSGTVALADPDTWKGLADTAIMIAKDPTMIDDVLKQSGSEFIAWDEITGDNPARGVGEALGNIGSLFIPGGALAKGGSVAKGLAATRHLLDGGGLEGLGRLPGLGGNRTPDMPELPDAPDAPNIPEFTPPPGIPDSVLGPASPSSPGGPSSPTPTAPSSPGSGSGGGPSGPAPSSNGSGPSQTGAGPGSPSSSGPAPTGGSPSTGGSSGGPSSNGPVPAGGSPSPSGGDGPSKPSGGAPVSPSSSSPADSPGSSGPTPSPSGASPAGGGDGPGSQSSSGGGSNSGGGSSGGGDGPGDSSSNAGGSNSGGSDGQADSSSGGSGLGSSGDSTGADSTDSATAHAKDDVAGPGNQIPDNADGTASGTESAEGADISRADESHRSQDDSPVHPRDYDIDGRTIPTDELAHPEADLLDQGLLDDAASKPDRVADALTPGAPSTHPEVQSMVSDGYDPHGGLPEDDWNREYWPSGARDMHGNPDLVWPDPQDHPQGFSAPEDRTPAVLKPGDSFDRFGPGFGQFGSPVGTEFSARGLPPNSLDAGYHRYEVVRPIPIWEGPIAPAMGQPGGGTQYYFPRSIVDLVNAGYLREVKL